MMNPKPKRPIATSRVIHSGIGDSAVVAILMAMASWTRKSRKKKEYYRHVVRIARLDPEQSDDFINFAATAASIALKGKAHVQTSIKISINNVQYEKG